MVWLEPVHEVQSALHAPWMDNWEKYAPLQASETLWAT